jgi:hypothetical protein
MTNPARSDIQEGLEDLLVVERNDLPRALVGMRGRYQLEGWRDAEGNVRQFECSILKITPQLINLSAPVTGAVGNWAVAHFEHLGKLEGPIIQIHQRALVVKIFGTLADRTKLASKMAWIMDAGKPQARRHFRMVPVTPGSVVSLPGEPALPCEVIDYSVGGAAVYSEATPAIGSVVKIGKILGRVVRVFGGGFAVSFMAVQNPQVVEEAIFQPTTPVNQVTQAS